MERETTKRVSIICLVMVVISLLMYSYSFLHLNPFANLTSLQSETATITGQTLPTIAVSATNTPTIAVSATNYSPTIAVSTTLSQVSNIIYIQESINEFLQ
eukprot:197395_1